MADNREEEHQQITRQAEALRDEAEALNKDVQALGRKVDDQIAKHAVDLQTLRSNLSGLDHRLQSLRGAITVLHDALDRLHPLPPEPAPPAPKRRGGHS